MEHQYAVKPQVVNSEYVCHKLKCYGLFHEHTKIPNQAQSVKEWLLKHEVEIHRKSLQTIAPLQSSPFRGLT